MKKIAAIIISSLVIVSGLISCNKTNSIQTFEDKKLNKINTGSLIDNLKLKADSARLYCSEKNMNTDFCILVDMKIHSGKKRFFVWDMNADTIIYSSLCAHGYGNGSTQTKPVFSNTPGSYCTSLGKYKTGERSYSKWGINIHYKLHGQDKTNNNAYERIVVLHSYDYVPEFEIAPSHLPLGFSQGCPVIDNTVMKNLDEMLKKENLPTLLWIYH